MIRKCYYIAWCLFLLFSCSEVIDLDTDEGGGQVVVDGLINNGTEGNEVKIKRTQSGGRPPQPITGLEVFVHDDLGNTSRLVEINEPGVYTLRSDEVQRVPGRTIWLTFDLSGNSYQSNPQTMQRLIAQDSLTWEVRLEKSVNTNGGVFEEEVVRLYANTRMLELPEEFYIRWEIEEVYNVQEAFLPPQNFLMRQAMCFIYNDLSEQEIILLNGRIIRNFNLNNRELVARRVDRSFSLKHYFNFVQMALTRESHDYWEKVNQLTTRSGSIFDVPPAEIPGNIVSSDPDEVVLGIFDVAQMDTARTLLTNNDIRYYFEDTCYTVGAARFYQLISVPYNCRQCVVDRGYMPQGCIDCLTLINSSFRRPSYF